MKKERKKKEYPFSRKTIDFTEENLSVYTRFHSCHLFKAKSELAVSGYAVLLQK